MSRKSDANPDRPTRYPGERSRWLVPSESQPAYPVLIDMDEYDGIGWCCCEDFQFRKQPELERGERRPELRCRHIFAVIEEQRRQAKAERQKEKSCQHSVVQTMNGQSFCAQCGVQI